MDNSLKATPVLCVIIPFFDLVKFSICADILAPAARSAAPYWHPNHSVNRILFQFSLFLVILPFQNTHPSEGSDPSNRK